MIEEPEEIIGGGGKLRNRLYLRRVCIYADRVSIEVYTSRSFAPSDFADLTLGDDLGTNYEMQGLPPEGLEGKGKIEFKPSPPTGWKRLHLGEPGWGLHVVELRQAG
jgi:hypothetical protein